MYCNFKKLDKECQKLLPRLEKSGAF
jgi:hypothetical protein